MANRPWFGELEFRLIGDGRLFDEVLAPLRSFPNVIIERRFLSPDELCAMHREYGIFLCPSRWDSQGVSRDEAMASGLVPITNAVGAIPEFVDSDCGFLAPPEDSAGLAAGIEEIYVDEARFAALSFNASRRVRNQSDIDDIVVTEMSMFGTDHPATIGGRRSRGFSLPTEHHSRHDFPETTEKPREGPRTRSLKTLLEAPTAMGGEPERVMGFSEAPVDVNAQALGRENLQRGKMVNEQAPRQAPVSAAVGYSLAGRLSRQVSRFLSPLRREISKRNMRRVVASSPLFDAQWYGLSYPDVTAAGIDPVAHYLERGAVELRNPSSHFDTAVYLDRYPDVRESGLNPSRNYDRTGPTRRSGRGNRWCRSFCPRKTGLLSCRMPSGACLSRHGTPGSYSSWTTAAWTGLSRSCAAIFPTRGSSSCTARGKGYAMLVTLAFPTHKVSFSPISTATTPGHLSTLSSCSPS